MVGGKMKRRRGRKGGEGGREETEEGRRGREGGEGGREEREGGREGGRVRETHTVVHGISYLLAANSSRINSCHHWVLIIKAHFTNTHPHTIILMSPLYHCINT